MSPHVTIHHVTRQIPPPRLDDCIAFYAILGFKPVPVPDGIAGRAFWLQSDGAPQQVHLMWAAEAGAAGAGAAEAGVAEAGAADAGAADAGVAEAGGADAGAAEARPASGHFALVCPDYDATVKSLRESGAEVEPRREHWGSPRAYVRDPAGNLVELMAWPPGGAPE